MRVLIGLGGVLTALLGALWALFALIAASPCGLEGGGGLLRGSSRCPVQAGNVASALVAAPGLVVVGVATVLALLYALTGRTRFVEGVRRAWLIIAAIALLWIILVGILPSPSVNNSSRDGEHIRFADVRVGVFLNVAVTLRPHGLEFRPVALGRERPHRIVTGEQRLVPRRIRSSRSFSWLARGCLKARRRAREGRRRF